MLPSSSRSSSNHFAKEAFIPTLCLVGCCKSKRRHPAPAKDLYCSALFQLSRKWAEQHADAWAILSAHYGVVKPDEVIEPYDTTINQHRPFGQAPLRPREYDTWLYGQVQVWCCPYATPRHGPRVIVLAGKDYWSLLTGHGLDLHIPLDGMGIGERLRWLKQQIDTSSKGTVAAPKQPMLFSTHDPF